MSVSLVKEPAVRCMTMGCREAATARMDYVMFGDGVTLSDNVCPDCLGSYLRRSAIRIVALSAPTRELAIVAPGLGAPLG